MPKYVPKNTTRGVVLSSKESPKESPKESSSLSEGGSKHKKSVQFDISQEDNATLSSPSTPTMPTRGVLRKKKVNELNPTGLASDEDREGEEVDEDKDSDRWGRPKSATKKKGPAELGL